jgi:hypothetical protein
LNVPEDRVINIAFLREFLGLPISRPDGVRDLLVIPRKGGTPLSGPWRLALGDWPGEWRSSPSSAPQFLVVLHGLTPPYFVAGIWEIDHHLWGSDVSGDRGLREVPMIPRPHEATSHLAGCELDTDMTFGWPLPEEQYAFW